MLITMPVTEKVAGISIIPFVAILKLGITGYN